ncbi:MAG: putative metal-binding motif-containing protein [Myxococcales bacterium]|nr:putative metal-binding motif-containing protein [Myxococcales bacterium]
MLLRFLGIGLAVGLVVGCSEAMPMPPDASAVDAAAAMDSAVPGMDGGARCAGDAECDDGLFCNGVERCVAGACEAGTPVDCDDGIACTVDTCSEDDAECQSAAPDSDGDGVGDATCRDADGLALGTDCDDADPNRYPDNPEICDAEGHDEDCDPLTFGAQDLDGDGHVWDQCCNDAPDGTRACGDDCDDGQFYVFEGAPELCDELDNDCNGLTDDDIRSRTFGIDCDGDRFGVATDPPIVDCALPTDPIACAGGVWVPDATDCDDTNASRNPGLVEVCDGIDNNCDPAGAIDEGVSDVDYYPDCDGDTHGDAAAAPRAECRVPTDPPAGCPTGGWSTTPTDCDDTNPRRHRGRPEVCDGIDNDCDPMELADDGLTFVDYYADCDLDAHGAGAANRSCSFPVSAPACGGAWVTTGDDCDDDAFSRHPGHPEVCDGIDNDCDASNLVDDGLAFADYHPDCDADGYGDASATPLSSCMFPATAPSCAGGVWSTNATDCDDADPTRNPGRLEMCDGVDNNCDPGGVADEGLAVTSYYPDCDRDGHGRDVAARTDCRAPTGGPPVCTAGLWATTRDDCDDTDGARSPTSTELCNGVDDDCDMLLDDVIDGVEVCSPGDSRGCTTGCGTPGTQDCDGCVAWGPCRGTEVCNGCDDDANGMPDDTFTCAAGISVQSCLTASCGSVGSQVCGPTCEWAACGGAAEVCNYCDDDGDGDYNEERALATATASEPVMGCDATQVFGAATCQTVALGGGDEDLYVELLDGTTMNQTGAYWFRPADWVQGWGTTTLEVELEVTRMAGMGGDFEVPLGGWAIVLATGSSTGVGPAIVAGVPTAQPGTAVRWLWSQPNGGFACFPADLPPNDGDAVWATHSGASRSNQDGSTTCSSTISPLSPGSPLQRTTTGTVTQRLRLEYTPDDPTTLATSEERLRVVAGGASNQVLPSAPSYPVRNDMPIGTSPYHIGITAGTYVASGFRSSGVDPSDTFGVPVRARVRISSTRSGVVTEAITLDRERVCP